MRMEVGVGCEGAEVHEGEVSCEGKWMNEVVDGRIWRRGVRGEGE